MSELSLHQTIYAVIGELRLTAAAGLKFAGQPHEVERYIRVRMAAAVENNHSKRC